MQGITWGSWEAHVDGEVNNHGKPLPSHRDKRRGRCYQNPGARVPSSPSCRGDTVTTGVASHSRGKGKMCLVYLSHCPFSFFLLTPPIGQISLIASWLWILEMQPAGISAPSHTEQNREKMRDGKQAQKQHRSLPIEKDLYFGLLWLNWLKKKICLQCRRPGFDPWVGKIPWRRKRLPTPVFWPKEFHGLYSPWGCKESDMTVTFTLASSYY